MKIIDYIKKMEHLHFHIDTDRLSMRYSEPSRNDDTWMEMEVDYYVLFYDFPLWKFNDFYNQWYAVKDKIYAAGTMGDFMSDTPTDEQIEHFITFGEIKF